MTRFQPKAAVVVPGSVENTACGVTEPVLPPVAEALIAVADEIGRLLARRDHSAARKRPRGYSLPEGLLGIAIVAAVILLVYRSRW